MIDYVRRATWLAALLCIALALPAWARTDRSIEEVALAQLPQEAAQTLALVKTDGPFPYRRDGAVFRNRERRLPSKEQGYYREYTVPTPGAKDRGPRRIVAGRDSDYYYTDDHYRTFRRIRE